MSLCKWGKPGKCSRPAKWYLSNDDVGGDVCDRHRKVMRRDLARYGQPVHEQALTA